MSPDTNPLPDDATAPALSLLAGRYQLLDKLGEGGMGAVFRARDTKLDRHVAVKVLPKDSIHDAEAVARFQRKAKALARLSHPGIIQAFDSGEDGDKHFLVMELVEGRSLGQELADKGRIPPTRAADHAHQAALALHHAHRNGLIHRDVKPSNLLLSTDGRVKLLDLGLARFLQDQVGDSTLTQVGSGMGTPDYAAPEQFRDAHHADPRSDIYSLGCTLFHLIAGRVPFPGSSMSEKVKAHETKEPPPLEELCPEVPGGLALAVQRMMAKRPADRFQSMAEVAEALAPYVAGSSASFRQIRDTSTWTGAQLETMTALPRRRRRVAWLVAGLAAALVLVAVGVVGFATGWFRPGEPDLAQGAPPPITTGKEATEKQPADASKPKTEDEPKKDDPKKEEPREPNVLSVAQKPGAAQYQTITAALNDVKPGQTIRVLDDAVYHETLSIKGQDVHAGITLEAPRGAVLERDTPGGIMLHVVGVPGVTVRGLRVRTKKRNGPHSSASRAPGLRLESLELSSDGEPTTNGIELLGSDTEPNPAPMVFQSCTFQGLEVAVALVGDATDSVSNLALRDGWFADCYIGFRITGRAKRLQVVGNRFSGMLLSGTQLQLLAPDSENILIANNTFFDCAAAFRLWDSKVKGKAVRLQNNVLLGGPSPDMHFLDADKPDTMKGPGDGSAVAKVYDLGHNWREGRLPTPGANTRAWIPPDKDKGDVFQETIDGMKRDRKSPDFLRPDAKSKLATAEAGNEDPSLPRYVGALPPEGTDPWDWDRAWRMPKDAQLLTVSKDAKDGGKYRTITDALKAAKPWATIRVLDAAVYQETITLNQEGLSLEAPKRAAILLAGNARQALVVRGVPRVRVSGFAIRQQEGRKEEVFRVLVQINGDCPGLTLENLELRPVYKTTAVTLQDFSGLTDAPICVARCRIDGGNPSDGIVVSGPTNASMAPSKCLALRENRIRGVYRGIHMMGGLADIQVTGNQIVDCLQEGIGVEDLTSNAARILIANNTLYNCETGVRGWLNGSADLHPGQVEVLSNLALEHVGGDMLICVNSDNINAAPSREKGELALKVWRFEGNARDLLGMGPLIPLARSDRKLDAAAGLPRDASRADFLRPPSASPLATQGAGMRDSGLPLYIGALPRESDSTWDWDRTWRARVKPTEDKKGQP